MNIRLQKRNLISALFQVCCLALGIALLFPLVYCVLISFTHDADLIAGKSLLASGVFTWDNYIEVIRGTMILRFLFNSFVVALGTSLARVITSTFAAFAFAFFDFPLKKFFFTLVLATLIVPAEMLMIPNYFVTSSLGLINTYLGMMVIYMVSAANIFLLRQNFLSYSMAVYEASKIDGCSNFVFLLRILIPMSKSVIATVFISSFVTSWNAYLWPLLVTNMEKMRTAQVIITMFNVSELKTSYGQIMAAAVLILIPSIAIFIIFQRWITGSLQGAVKE